MAAQRTDQQDVLTCGILPKRVGTNPGGPHECEGQNFGLLSSSDVFCWVRQQTDREMPRISETFHLASSSIPYEDEILLTYYKIER